MHCRKIQQQLSQLPSREIPEGALSEHLSTCSACAAAHTRFWEIMDVIEQDRITEVHPWFITRLEARLEQKSNIDFAGIFRLKPVAITLSLLLPLLAGIWLGYNTFNNNQQQQQDYELIAEVNNLLSTPGYGEDTWYLAEE
ncbi:MAG: hypothetical protein R6V49_04240 [Bacteroidales bacterium]